MSNQQRPLIVNIWGSPGSGKSTTSAGVFSELKLRGVKAELVTEWMKTKVYSGDTYVPTDSLYIFAKQRKAILEIGNNADVIIVDTPLPQGIIYDNDNALLNELRWQEFHKMDNVNYLIKRSKPYVSEGRYQTEEESNGLSERIYDMMYINDLHFHVYKGDVTAISSIVEDLFSSHINN